MNSEKKSNKILTFFKRFLTWQLFLGLLIGAIGGYAYYYFIGCNSGSCPITSNPINTILYGTLIGGLLGFKDKNKTKIKEEAENQENKLISDN